MKAGEMKEPCDSNEVSSSSDILTDNTMNNNQAITAEQHETTVISTTLDQDQEKEKEKIDKLENIISDMKGKEEEILMELDVAKNEILRLHVLLESKQEHQESVPQQQEEQHSEQQILQQKEGQEQQQQQQQRISELETQLQLVSHWLQSVTSSSDYAYDGDKGEGGEIYDVGSQMDLVDAIITDLCVQNEEILDRLYEFEMTARNDSPGGIDSTRRSGESVRSPSIRDRKGSENSKSLSAAHHVLGSRKMSLKGTDGAAGGGGVIDGSWKLETVRNEPESLKYATSAAATTVVETAITAGTTAATITTTNSTVTTKATPTTPTSDAIIQNLTSQLAALHESTAKTIQELEATNRQTKEEYTQHLKECQMATIATTSSTLAKGSSKSAKTSGKGAPPMMVHNPPPVGFFSSLLQSI